MDLFSTFFGGKPVPLQVDKFTRVFQKSPLTMDNPPPPLPAGNSLYQLPRRQRGFGHCNIAFSLMVV